MNQIKTQSLRAIFLLPSLLCATVLTHSLASAGDDWTSFRNGGHSQTRSTLPTQWSPDQGIAWQHELVGYGQSAPVIFNGKVIVTAVEGPMCEKLVVQCFDLSSGATLWQHDQETSVVHPSNYMNARAAPTPLVDQDAVYAFFETGDFVCLNHEGKPLWHRNEAEAFGQFGNNHGIGSSPTMDDQNLYLLIEHDGPSSLAAINKKSGETTWKTDRKSTKSWSSPIVADVSNGDRTIIVSSGGTVTGYSAADGTQQWQIDGVEGNSVPSPTATDNFLLVGARLPEFATDGQVRANCCLDLSQMSNGEPKVLWRAEKAICDYASPVALGGHAYFLNKANVLHCLDTSSGELAYRERLSLSCWATPIVSDGAIFYFGKNGQTRIVQPGPEFVEIASNHLWDPEAPPAPVSYVESERSHGGAGHGAAGHGAAGHGGAGHGTASHGGPSHGHGKHGRASHGHGKHGHEAHGHEKHGEAKHEGEGHAGASSHDAQPSSRESGIVARMLAGDANQDGVLEGDEVPAMFRPMMSRIDSDGDGKINREELEAMAKSFAERRKNSASSARDPIVYGVAAADGKIAVRTGTRLYVIDGTP